MVWALLKTTNTTKLQQGEFSPVNFLKSLIWSPTQMHQMIKIVDNYKTGLLLYNLKRCHHHLHPKYHHCNRKQVSINHLIFWIIKSLINYRIKKRVMYIKSLQCVQNPCRNNCYCLTKPSCRMLDLSLILSFSTSRKLQI